ncbi:26.5 kDa heat shock protein, mitochondrial [Juglans microcarpa x Juglans regia]|uniref:26.5 kDa heat shock protein, mitochondrial n=1 Tax=Juglans microcarpa x Juglans regia TaxID=2249226 RepID=UPI001B7F3315|nr:26.5 kDa heat shock protein, mitochondrial [Juglans microcarpa x Juglans regia]
MALPRLASKSILQRVLASNSLLGQGARERSVGGVQRQRWGNEIVRTFTAADVDKVAGEKTEHGKDQVAVSEGGKKSMLFPKRQRKRWLWRNKDRHDFSPAHYDFFSSGLGNALMQATQNINSLFEKLNITPWTLSGRVKEKDNSYVLRYEVPGLSKEDLKLTIDDGVLTITGEHKEENEDDSDDESWSAASYGYYHTSLLLPEDAKIDEVKAELKDGVLTIVIPRTEMPKKDVKEVKVH